MNFIVLALIFTPTVIAQEAKVNSLACGDDSWIPYKDEKCVKLIKSLVSRREAQQLCSEQFSSLITIHSAEEQLFLNEYVFNSSVENSVWIGAERLPNSPTQFEWDDGSPVDLFTNWAVGRPSNIVGRTCVQMQSELSSRQLSDLEWHDVACTGGHWFFCQKLQTWPIEEFQRAILSLRRDTENLAQDLADLRSEIIAFRNLTSEMANIRSEITTLRNELTSETANRRSEIASETTARRNDISSVRSDLTTETTNRKSEITNESTARRNDITSVKSDLTSETNNRRNDITSVRSDLTSETNNRRNDITSVRSDLTTTRNSVTSLQANPVPIGFIYVQLSGQSEPRTVWGTGTWTEVSSQYAGLFFRAVGGGSATFGSTQAEFSPRLIQVDRSTFSNPGGSNAIGIPTSGPSAYLTVGASTSGSVWDLRFTLSSGEVRPRNSAIRIWRRSA